MYYNVLDKKLEKINELFNLREIKNSKILIAAPHGGKYIPQDSCNYLDYNNLTFPLEIDQNVNEIYDINSFSFATTKIHRHVINLNGNKYKNGKLRVFRNKGFNKQNLYTEPINDAKKKN